MKKAGVVTKKMLLLVALCAPFTLPAHIHAGAGAGAPTDAKTTGRSKTLDVRAGIIEHELFDKAFLKDLELFLNDENFWYLLPATGLALIESRWLRHAWFNADLEPSDTNTLLRILFHAPPANPDDVSLAKIDTLPAAHLTAPFVGKLIGLVLTKKLDVAYPTNTAFIQEFRAVCDQDKKVEERHIREFFATLKGAVLEAQPTRGSRMEPQTRAPKLTKGQVAALEARGEAAPQDSVEQVEVKAGRYLPDTPVWLLISALCWIVQTKQDVYDYLQAIEETVRTQSTPPAQSGKRKGAQQPPIATISLKPVSDAGVQRVLHEASRFTPEEAQLFLRGTTAENVEPLLRHYLMSVYARSTQRQTSVPLPPQAAQGYVGYQGQETTANCIEATVQNLFDALLYDPTTQRFSWAMLPSATAGKARETLKAYYAGISFDPSKVSRPTTRQAFEDVISNIAGVTYYRGRPDARYELAGPTSNVLTAVNYLLGTSVERFDDLAPLLTTAERTVQISTTTTKAPNQGMQDNITFTFTYAHLKNEFGTPLKAEFRMEIQPSHSHITYIEGPDSQRKKNELIARELFERVAHTTSDSRSAALFTLYAPQDGDDPWRLDDDDTSDTESAGGGPAVAEPGVHTLEQEAEQPEEDTAGVDSSSSRGSEHAEEQADHDDTPDTSSVVSDEGQPRIYSLNRDSLGGKILTTFTRYAEESSPALMPLIRFITNIIPPRDIQTFNEGIIHTLYRLLREQPNTPELHAFFLALLTYVARTDGIEHADNLDDLFAEFQIIQAFPPHLMRPFLEQYHGLSAALHQFKTSKKRESLQELVMQLLAHNDPKIAAPYGLTPLLALLGSWANYADPDDLDETLRFGGILNGLRLDHGYAQNPDDAYAQKHLQPFIRWQHYVTALALRLINEGADVNAAAHSGLTPLMLAAAMGLTEVVNDLLAHGAHAQATTPAGVTALHFAAYGAGGKAATERIMAALLKAKCPLEPVTQSGMTPLTMASPDAMEFLMNRGAKKGLNVAMRNNNEPPIMRVVGSAYSNKLQLIKRLLKQGADVTTRALYDYYGDEATNNRYSGNALTNLSFVDPEERNELAKLLLDRGARPEDISPDSFTAVIDTIFQVNRQAAERAIKAWNVSEQPAIADGMPLWERVSWIQTPEIKTTLLKRLILQAGDVATLPQDSSQSTILHMIARAQEPGRTELMKFAMDHGGAALLHRANAEGKTPVQFIHDDIRYNTEGAQALLDYLRQYDTKQRGQEQGDAYDRIDLRYPSANEQSQEINLGASLDRVDLRYPPANEQSREINLGAVDLRSLSLEDQQPMIDLRDPAFDEGQPYEPSIIEIIRSRAPDALELVRERLERGDDANVKDENGNALSYLGPSWQDDQIELAALLLRHGARPRDIAAIRVPVVIETIAAANPEAAQQAIAAWDPSEFSDEFGDPTLWERIMRISDPKLRIPLLKKIMVHGSNGRVLTFHGESILHHIARLPEPERLELLLFALRHGYAPLLMQAGGFRGKEKTPLDVLRENPGDDEKAYQITMNYLSPYLPTGTASSIQQPDSPASAASTLTASSPTHRAPPPPPPAPPFLGRPTQAHHQEAAMARHASPGRELREPGKLDAANDPRIPSLAAALTLRQQQAGAAGTADTEPTTTSFQSRLQLWRDRDAQDRQGRQ